MTATKTPRISPRESWGEAKKRLAQHVRGGEAEANTTLLDALQQKWQDRVEVVTSHHSLWFVAPGDDYPFRKGRVSVAWEDGVYRFVLMEPRHIITIDHCKAGNVVPVAESFIVQLVGGDI